MQKLLGRFFAVVDLHVGEVVPVGDLASVQIVLLVFNAWGTSKHCSLQFCQTALLPSHCGKGLAVRQEDGSSPGVTMKLAAVICTFALLCLAATSKCGAQR